MLKFGVAGYPPAYQDSPYRKDRLQIFQWLHELGLDAFEAQMTYGPRTRPEVCREMRRRAAEFGIKISVHAAYYIVLTSADKAVVARSADTLKRTYELADIMGADTIVLHPGPLYGEDETDVRPRFADNLSNFFAAFNPGEIGLFIETAGKKGQLGSTEDIISLSKEIPGCFPCFDFGHIHARTNGSLDSAAKVDSLLAYLAAEGVFERRCHFHYTPIDFGPKGEITHKAIEDFYPPTAQADLFAASAEPQPYHPRFEPVAAGLRRYNVTATVISETHDSQERGALALQKAYRRA